ncbi:dihydroorotase [Candidatus Uhrbacteria bacterium]|nr:dihydroorotase [Candidatus Uhrbacteria bacterium]
MIVIKNVTTVSGQVETCKIKSAEDRIIEGEGLHIFPAFIDPHVHFRVPGGEHKENWETGARAAIAGGVTTVFDMPNNNPPCTTLERLQEKRKMIDEQLSRTSIPLRYYLYLGADSSSIDEIEKCAKEIIGIKVFLGSSTGNLLIERYDDFERICQIAARFGLVVAVHAEDEEVMQQHKSEYSDVQDVSFHSKIRARDCAVVALERALATARKYGILLYILHASTADEIEMVRHAKRDGLNVFLETTPHHLFLNETAYTTLGTRAQMNPPLRTAADNEALWKGIEDGTIDTIGTDHAPHTIKEKDQVYGIAPSGVPGIENYFALFLDAAYKGRITYNKIIDITRGNIEQIFDIPQNNDVVLVDTALEKEIKNENQKTKCGWSPYAGMRLRGWPVHTIVGGKVFTV